jgi:hypothetical protein
LKKLRALYEGKAPTLYKNYRFAGYKFDKKKRTFGSLGAVNSNSMKVGLTQLVNRINKQIIKPLAEASYVLFIGQTVPFYCSEGKFEDPACRQLIGKAIYDAQLKFDDVQHHKNDAPAVERQMNPLSLDYKYVAYVRNIEQKVIKRVNLTRDFNQAKSMYNGMVGEGKDYQVGAIGHSSLQ